MDEYTPWIKRLGCHKHPSLGDGMSDYANLPETKAAMNIPDYITKPWTSCSGGNANFSYTSQEEGSIWIYPILRGKYRILFYSGDTDGAVPTYGSRLWINNLNWKINE
jgi:hypothetical protein